MADYESSHSGSQLDQTIHSVLHPDTVVKEGSAQLVTSGAVADAVGNAVAKSDKRLNSLGINTFESIDGRMFIQLKEGDEEQDLTSIPVATESNSGVMSKEQVKTLNEHGVKLQNLEAKDKNHDTTLGRIDDDLKGINEGLVAHNSRITTLETDAKTLKKDVRDIKEDVSELEKFTIEQLRNLDTKTKEQDTLISKNEKRIDALTLNTSEVSDGRISLALEEKGGEVLSDTILLVANESRSGVMSKEHVKSVNENTAKLLDIERDFGHYEQHPDVTLEVVHTGKRFNSQGELVSDANWNVGRLGAVERGLLYELMMGGEDKMVQGTALFVSHTVETFQTQTRDVYTPVYSAMGTALPISTYAVLWAGENYTDLLVSYRNDVQGANVMKVAEWGIFKSIATQYSNMQTKLDLKSFADGYYAGMRVGNADSLTPNGETAPVYEEIITAGRMVNDAPDVMGNRTPSATNAVSNISIKNMMGEVLGMNQLVPVDGGSVELQKDHKFLSIINGAYTIFTVSEKKTRTYAKGDMLLDLTTKFPTTAGSAFVNSLTNNNANAVKVMHRLSTFVYNRDSAGNATQLEDEALEKGAEVIAKLGYQEPKLCTGTCGRINLFDGNTGLKKQTLDMITAKNKAWKQVLAALAEQGIDTSAEWCQIPFEASINETVGIFWDNKGVTVKAWMGRYQDLGVSVTYILSYVTENHHIASISKDVATSKGIGDLRNCLLLATKNTEAINSRTAQDNLKPHEWGAHHNGMAMYFEVSSRSMEEWADEMIMFELATPIRIDFDEELNLNLVDVKPYDLYGLDDIDGNPMYDINIETQEDGNIKTTVAPKAEWVEEHKQLPVGIYSTIVGLGTNANYDFIMKLEQRVRALENRQ